MSQVTVIIPVYNMEKYIDKCVKSVLEQSYDNFELVLIDDGSSDASLEKCIDWGRRDNRVIVVSKANSGLGPTRNLGVRMSKSEYITFLDSDDWWDPEYLRLMVEGTQGEANDIVLCDMNFVQKNEAGIYETSVSKLRFDCGLLDLQREKDVINRARTFMCGKLYRRSLFQDYNVEQPSHTYEDVATTPYLVACAKSIYYVPGGLYFYLRNRQGSIINDFSALRGLLQSLVEIYQRFQNSNQMQRFYVPLRRLFWGQLKYLYQSIVSRFPDENGAERERIRDDAQKIVCGYFPELEKMFDCTFGVPSGEEVIVEALEKIVVDKKKILGDFSKADFIITSVMKKQNIISGKVIRVHLSDQPKDRERAVWDIADEIFDEMWKVKQHEL